VSGSTESSKYSAVAITLHWVIAICIIGMIPLGLYMTDLPDEKVKLQFQLYQIHKSIGITILVLSVLRVIWRLTHKAPPLPPDMPAWEKLGAKLTHFGFYFLIVAIPLVGWAMVSTEKYYIPTVLYWVIPWPHMAFFDNMASKAAWNEFFDSAHYVLALLVVPLLVLHVGAALKHHFFERGEVLARMVPGLRPLDKK
jgi:cytochrome b561